MNQSARVQQFEGVLRESELRRALEQLRSIALSLSQGTDIRKHKKHIIECFTNGSHRNIRLAAFPLLKELSDLDYSSLVSTISADLSSTDLEIQLIAMKLLNYLPYSVNVELLTQYGKEFNKMLIIPEFHYERLFVFSELLLKIYLQSRTSENEDEVFYTISDFLTNISELVFHASRDIARNAIEVFNRFYYQYKTDDFELYSTESFFQGNGSLSYLLKPLIIQITNLFFPKLQIITSKIASFEIRTQVSLLSFPISILTVGLSLKSEFKEHNGKDILARTHTKTLVFEFETGKVPIEKLFTSILTEYILKNIRFYSLEVDYVIPLFNAFFEMLSFANTDAGYFLISEQLRNAIVKEAVLEFFELLGKVAYKKDLNIVLLNFVMCAQYLHKSLKLFMILRLFEFTNRNVVNTLTKYYIYFTCFTLIIELSLELVQEKQHSAIFALFQQPWFILKFSDQDENGGIRFKQEVLVCLIFSTFHIRQLIGGDKEKQVVFNQILVEILDLASTIIEWKIEKLFTSVRDEQSYLFAFELYLLLLDEAIQANMNKEVEVHVMELIKRISANELSHVLKWKSLLMLSKHLEPQVLEQIKFQELVTELKSSIINKKFIEISKETFVGSLSDSTYVRYWINKIESGISIMIKLVAKYPNDKNAVVNVLSEYDEFLIKINNNNDSYQPLISCVMDYVEFCIKILTQGEEHLIDTTHISTNMLDELELAEEDELQLHRYRTCQELISVAYNVYYYKSSSRVRHFLNDMLQVGNFVNNVKPLVQEAAGEDSLNCQLKQERLITGAGDFVQVYASHALQQADNLIAVQLRVCNITKFALDRVLFRVHGEKYFDLLPNVLGKKEQAVEEIPPNQAKMVYFTLKLRQAYCSQILFDIEVETPDLDDTLRIQTLAYQFNLMEFAIPDNILRLNSSLFNKYHESLTYFRKHNCTVNTTLDDLLSQLSQKCLGVCVSYSSKQAGEWTHIGLMGHLWDQNSVSISLMRSGEYESKNSAISLEIRTSRFELMSNIESNIDAVLAFLFRGRVLCIN